MVTGPATRRWRYRPTAIGRHNWSGAASARVGGCRCSMRTLGVWSTGVNRTLVLLELELDHARPVSPVNRRESNQSSLRGGGPRLPLPPGTIRTMGRERGLGSCNSPLLISPARQARRSALDSSAGQSVRWGGSEGWALVTRFFSSLRRGRRGGPRLALPPGNPYDEEGARAGLLQLASSHLCDDGPRLTLPPCNP